MEKNLSTQQALTGYNNIPEMLLQHLGNMIADLCQVSNGNTRAMCEVLTNLTTKAAKRH